MSTPIEKQNIKIHRIIAPVIEEQLDRKKAFVRTGFDKAWFSYPDVPAGISIETLDNHKNHVVQLFTQLCETNGSITVFHMYADYSALGHGVFTEREFALSREDGKYQLVNDYKSIEGYPVIGGEHGISFCGSELKELRDDPESLVRRSFETGKLVDHDFDMEIQLPDALIKTDNFSGLITNTRFEMEFHSAQGVTQYPLRENAYLGIAISGTEKSVMRYYNMFESKLGTAFFPPKYTK